MKNLTGEGMVLHREAEGNEDRPPVLEWDRVTGIVLDATRLGANMVGTFKLGRTKLSGLGGLRLKGQIVILDPLRKNSCHNP